MSVAAIRIAKREMVLSPLKAVRRHCLWCCCDQALEVRLCPAADCPLHPYRLRKGPDVKPKLTVLKSIRTRCIDCGGGSLGSVRECWNTECVLFHYRMGKNPNMKGRKGNVDALRRWQETHAQNRRE